MYINIQERLFVLFESSINTKRKPLNLPHLQATVHRKPFLKGKNTDTIARIPVQSLIQYVSNLASDSLSTQWGNNSFHFIKSLEKLN